MSLSKRYNIINNSLGWLCFIIAAVSYVLTIEPTASFWDCPEFITQGYKLEVGHPPGNPIFMLTARFFITVLGAETGTVAAAVNTMNALLSAGTILLLFWTITHLMRRLLTGYKPLEEITVPQQITIFASGLVGALAYAWSDTFWYSAVEGEVYAFSSFCTALVFWLILKWENRADQPHSDRYLVLIAYVIGVSIAVHLLNLLCIPAIVLVFYYRKFANVNAKGSVIALLVSFAIVAVILYGLVPGFIEVAQYSELLFVNVFGLGYNVGVLVYTILTLATFIWAVTELYNQKSALRLKVAFALSILMSGIPFIGSSLIIPVLIMGALIVWLWRAGKIHVRILNVITLSIFVIFIGYSSYALLLIRSAADTPVNQNAPDNVFDLGSYLNREQYGMAPLLYGTTFAYVKDGNGGRYSNVYRQKWTVNPQYIDKYLVDERGGDKEYAKALPDSCGNVTPGYELIDKAVDTSVYVPELNMLFPRMYDGRFADVDRGYMWWAGINRQDLKPVEVLPIKDDSRTKQTVWAPTFGQNMSYFVNYQLIHMYFRYFMWNFAGRQNDLQGNGEADRGNWISGIPFIDNFRLGDQGNLPYYKGEGNKGHNVFYMLPLLLGLAGLCWQSFKGDTGIRQFWVVFFLFFMTGIAIVLYLNQTPNQPRERDYAYAGSFYAFAIWIGLGVGAVTALLNRVVKSGKEGKSPVAAIVAALLCLIVPVQMVSQTWDDHDRSGRFTARDFGMNYLSSLEPNAIIFTNGDNDTFPLWYAQEVEGYRTDVRVINLSYLTQPWYVKQQLLPAYEAAPIEIMATENDFGHNRRAQGLVLYDSYAEPTDVRDFLADYYGAAPDSPLRHLQYERMYSDADGNSSLTRYRDIPFAMMVNDLVIPGDSVKGYEDIVISQFPKHVGSSLNLQNAIVLDIIANSAANGWNRPIYFANTVPNDYYMGLQDYMYNTGMAQQVLPRSVYSEEPTDVPMRAYRNIMDKFRWGGLDADGGDDVYLDETVQRMVFSTRHSIYVTAVDLYQDGRGKEALDLLNLLYEKLPAKNTPYDILARYIGSLLIDLGNEFGEKEAVRRGNELLEDQIVSYMQQIAWMSGLDDSRYASLKGDDRGALIEFEETQYGDYAVNSAVYDLLRLYLNQFDDEKAAVEALDSLSDKAGVDIVYYISALDNVSRYFDTAQSQILDDVQKKYMSNDMYGELDDEELYEAFIAEFKQRIGSLKVSTAASLREAIAKKVAAK